MAELKKDTGMLWTLFNQTKTDIEKLVKSGTDYFEQKYEAEVGEILCSSREFTDKTMVLGFELTPDTSVNPGYIIIYEKKDTKNG